MATSLRSVGQNDLKNVTPESQRQCGIRVMARTRSATLRADGRITSPCFQRGGRLGQDGKRCAALPSPSLAYKLEHELDRDSTPPLAASPLQDKHEKPVQTLSKWSCALRHSQRTDSRTHGRLDTWSGVRTRPSLSLVNWP
jgi:hypothetical protein